MILNCRLQSAVDGKPQTVAVIAATLHFSFSADARTRRLRNFTIRASRGAEQQFTLAMNEQEAYALRREITDAVDAARSVVRPDPPPPKGPRP